MRDFEKLERQDQSDIRSMAYANTHYLHYSTKIQECKDPMCCDLCMNSARLAVQWYRGRIEKRIINHISDMYDIRCNLHHPGGD